MDPPTLAVASLHHLALGARDVERVGAFYREVLGLTELARHRHADGSLRSVWLSLGADAVLMVEGCSERRPPPGGVDERGMDANGKPARGETEPGWFLLAFRIEESRRSAWEARLAGAGAAIERRTAATSYARDPEGNRFAVSFYPLPRSGGGNRATRPGG